MESLIDGLDELIKRVRQEADEKVKVLEDAKARVGAAPPASTTKQRQRKPRSDKGKPRRKRKGTRSDQAAALIAENPGISASDVAKTLKIKPNYMYRVMGDLEKAGRVKKDGRSYFPATS